MLFSSCAPRRASSTSSTLSFAFLALVGFVVVLHRGEAGRIDIEDFATVVETEKSRTATVALSITDQDVDLFQMPTLTLSSMESGSDDETVYTKTESFEREIESGGLEIVWKGSNSNPGGYGFATLIQSSLNKNVAAILSTETSTFTLVTLPGGTLQLRETYWKDARDSKPMELGIFEGAAEGGLSGRGNGVDLTASSLLFQLPKSVVSKTSKGNGAGVLSEGPAGRMLRDNERNLQGCDDLPGWVDNTGETCVAYEENNWCVFGGGYANNKTGKVANEACCSCGGGSTGGGGCKDVQGWTDSVLDTCDLYSDYGWCTEYGDGYANTETGLTANDACCFCGGGDDGCKDIQGWVDSSGDNDCAVWEANGWCAYGGGFANQETGKTANEACCFCGGGSTGGGGCKDLEGWVDIRSDSCDRYAVNVADDWCGQFGDSFGNKDTGKTANDACCFCGGGSTKSASEPTGSPIESPTKSPVSPIGPPVVRQTKPPRTTNPVPIPSPRPVSVPFSVPAPTDKPSSVPTGSPSVAPSKTVATGGFLCFSDHMMVMVQGKKGATHMDELQIGDVVLTSKGYSRVYSFGHYEPSKWTEFLQIYTADSQQAPLEITADHLLYYHNHSTQNIELTPAGQVKVGDFLETSNGRLSQVEMIRKIHRQGIYAPFTESGDIVVNGILASIYIALPPAFQSHLSFEQQHWLQQKSYIPFRLFCHVVGCKTDDTDDTGFPMGVSMWLPLLHWLECQNGLALKSFLYLVAMPLALGLQLLECMFFNGWHVITAIVGFSLLMKRQWKGALKLHKF